MNHEAQRPEAADAQRLKQHLDELLDDALRESFPASDVPSIANAIFDEPRDADETTTAKPGVDARDPA
jgi:hypothetical protein